MLGWAVSQRQFHTLDALRGVAAVAILTRHLPGAHLEKYLPSSYLGVDLFFVLSGFVLAHAYEEKLRTRLSFSQFMVLRFVRLYPLYLLAAAIALPLVLMRGPGEMATAEYAVRAFGTAFSVLLFLPVLPGLSIWRDLPNAFPVNGARWSLLWELVANAVFAILAPRLSNRLLAVLIVIGGVATIAASLSFGSLAGGVYWSDMWVGGARVLFSFFAGTALYRLWLRRPLALSVPAWLLPIALLAVLAVPAPHPLRAFYDILAVIVLFPAIVLVSASSEPGRPWFGLFRELGSASYALYVLQFPLIYLADHVSKSIWGMPFATPGGKGDLVAIAAIVLVSAFLARVYDEPVRARIKSYTSRRRRLLGPASD